ncbi:MAG: hypothetical protein HYS22_00055 [Deltaproteobacteria bacterium]|nr:hypothetical protein [Deltaproteobacteria bacterium]
MKTKRNKILKKAVPLLALGLVLGLPLTTEAACLRDCAQDNAQDSGRAGNSYSGYGTNSYRDRSPTFGDNNTAILGDVNIHVGHDNVTIGGFGGNATGNFVDTSINSTIIMGNLKQ